MLSNEHSYLVPSEMTIYGYLAMLLTDQNKETQNDKRFHCLLRILNSKCNPFSGRKTNADFFNFTGISVFSFGSNENFSSKLYKIALISISAKREPKNMTNN